MHAERMSSFNGGSTIGLGQRGLVPTLIPKTHHLSNCIGCNAYFVREGIRWFARFLLLLLQDSSTTTVNHIKLPLAFNLLI